MLVRACNAIGYGFLTLARKRAPQGQTILVACTPKSGSTFVSSLISEVSGYPRVSLNTAGAVQELDPMALQLNEGRAGVAQIHLLCSPMVADVVNRYNMSVVVMDRDIADSIVSLRDFIETNEMHRQMRENGVITTDSFMLGRHYFDMSRAEQFDYLIDLAVPWYLRFQASWQHYRHRMKRPPLYVSYDTFFQNVPGRAARILSHCRIDADRITAALPRLGDTRFNVGRSGRGREILSPSQLDRIAALARHYPDGDFAH